MEDNIETYRIPAGFNPWKALDAIRGLTDAVEYFLREGPGAPEKQMSYIDRASLDGLLGSLQEKVHALHDYFIAIGDFTTLRLPLTEEDFKAIDVSRHKDEVREPPPPVLLFKRK